ncbi:hypothetical protein [Galbibacter pacificus]|uniref:ApeA N-terminal domain-containing protein n=1 Tax=Galbibacter pacificus TaxID=2996052 RepID=A0ABT6FX17_9FLAO|nr:hypothetical protein [Galbibacter pacificus]MDG3584218.1 hypothetical protein [Galbibacter pacificus]MDG3587694.1 hypothetical protein [Galbibacter pacificus]
MIEWINERFGTNFTEEQLINVKDFSLFWNIFENLVCGNHCNVNRLNERLNPIDFEIADFQENFEYFKERYTENGTTNARFEYLNFRNGDRKEFVANVLLGNENATSDIVLALTIIIYRFRNNLFHGLKNFMQIHEQEENFKNANQVIKSILTHF